MKKTFFVAIAAAALLASCDLSSTVDGPGQTTPAPTATPRIFLMGQDYTTKKAVLERVSDDSILAKDIKDWTTSDVILAALGDSLYVLNRKAGTVTGFTHGDPSKVFLDVQMTGSGDATGGANPYAVARIGGRLWVACYGSPFLKAVDLSSQKLVDSIDLSSYAYTGTKNPNTVDVHAWNGSLVVTMGRLNGWNPGDSSLVVVLNPSSKTATKRLALPWKNPYGISWKGDTLFVACVGKWFTDDYSDIVKDGGLAMVLPTSGVVKSILSEETAGANITDVEAVSSTKAFVGFGHANYSTTLAPVDLSTGAVGTSVTGVKSVAALAWTGKLLYVAEQDAAKPALFKVDVAGSVLGKVVPTLAPGSIAILP